MAWSGSRAAGAAGAARTARGLTPPHLTSRRTATIPKFAAILAVLLLKLPGGAPEARLSLSETDFHLLVDENKLFQLIQTGEVNQSVVVSLWAQHGDVIQLVPSRVELPPGAAPAPGPAAARAHDVCVLGKSPGHSEVTFNSTPPGRIQTGGMVMRVTVMYSREILLLSQLMGWVYFAAWSVSFYPQIWYNYSRRSVVGLNFDFLGLNLLGFLCYSLFNCGLYFSPLIQSEYFARHPQGLNPVQLNDVFFSLHAVLATLLTIAQCCAYERGEQRVSRAGAAVLSALAGVVAVSAALSTAGAAGLHWLDFLYYCSYVKLTITLIKYLPQAYMNYCRKSTVGWSIGNIFLDLVGGTLSMLQMLLNAYNYDDWVSIFGDITKFGLGLFSLLFDIFFILQHYVFYRNGEEKKVAAEIKA